MWPFNKKEKDGHPLEMFPEDIREYFEYLEKKIDCQQQEIARLEGRVEFLRNRLAEVKTRRVHNKDILDFFDKFVDRDLEETDRNPSMWKTNPQQTTGRVVRNKGQLTPKIDTLFK